jgi:Anion-transporting ATPase
MSPDSTSGSRASSSDRPRTRPAGGAAIALLSGRRLVVVTGKGGVGKSAVAAALGRALADSGRRVLVLEVDPRETAHEMFAVPPSGGRILEVASRLYVQNVRATQVLDELVAERLRIAALARRVLDSPIYRQFAESGPGLKELAVLGHALRVVSGKAREAPAVDVVVLDAPATGHGLALLAAPLLVAEVIERGPFGRLTREVAALVEDRDRTAVVAVTLAEEMPVSEVLELEAGLEERLGRGADLLVVNALYPPLPPGRAAEPGDPLFGLWRRRRALNEAELARVAAAWNGPRVELPLLPLERGPRLVAELAYHLRGAPGGER